MIDTLLSSGGSYIEEEIHQYESKKGFQVKGFMIRTDPKNQNATKDFEYITFVCMTKEEKRKFSSLVNEELHCKTFQEQVS